jgi:RNA polymerase sigma factor (sigma-70 family)
MQSDFIELIQQNQRLVHKVCWVYATDSDDRKDLFQEIVMQAWQSYANFKREAKFSTWLYRVAINTAITWNKKAKRKESFSSLGFELQEDDAITENKEAQFQMMYQAIAALNKVDKAIVTLYFEQMDYNEIGETLGISANHVAVKMGRIKQFIKNYVSKETAWN